MRIISKERDFYDGATAFVDPEFCYVRNEQEIKSKTSYFLPFPNPNFGNKKDHPENFILVFFCGVIYCGVLINEKWHYNESAAAFFPAKKKESGWWSRWSSPFIENHSVKTFFEMAGKDCREINLKYSSPVVVEFWKGSRNTAILIDCILNKYNFASAVDPYQARQDIETFLRNDLAKEFDIPVKISDKDRIKAHGFDVKTSFRKDTPPTRKQK